MTVEMLKKIESRHLYQTDSSELRVKRENLDLSVPIDHETTTRLPLVAAETMAVGYGFDRLYMVDLTNGKQTKLPSRADITKALADSAGNGVGSNARESVEKSLYRGVKATGRYSPGHIGLNDNGLSDMDIPVTGLFHSQLRRTQANDAGLSNNDVNFNGALAGKTASWKDASNDVFQTAYAGNGYTSGNAPKNQTYLNAHVYPGYVSEAGKKVVIDLDGIQRLSQDGESWSWANWDDFDNDDPEKMKDGRLLRGLGLLYEYLSPSCWDTIETNQDVLFQFSKGIKDVERTLDAIYNRGKSHFGVRNQEADLHKLIISLIELGASMRTKRFSRNIHEGSAVTDVPRWKIVEDGEEKDWYKGVVNDFFFVINDRYLIAPWWCVNQLNFYDFVEDEREKERRDIDRKDAIETLHLIFQYMDMEKGLHHGSDSTLPMLLFEKYKEGVLKDFSDYTSTDAAIAASLMGYRTPRDADHNIQSSTAGHVGYYATLPSAHGKLLGSEKAEFLDRLSEAEEHSMLASSSEYFKEGMQLASSFSYQAMVGRTRFGEAHCDFRVYPGGFSRGVKKAISYMNDTNGTPKTYNCLGVLWFPLLGWNQYSAGVSTKGFLPRNHNGAAYSRSYNEPVEWAPATAADQLLWPMSSNDMSNGDSYWQPGRDQYSALLLKGTNDLYNTWIDRVDTISTEGVTVPSFGAINLVAEMSYDTPHAMVTRNFPILRKLYQRAAQQTTPAADDTSFDFMSAGDNVHGTSEWMGETQWKLRDRHLMDADAKKAHHRSGSLDLMAYVYASSSLPESWVDVFQLRDWMMFHTALESEPIMDAYTRNHGNNGSWRNNGYINSRIVVYVDEVQNNGDVRDVTCTPIVGSFLLSSESSGSHSTMEYSKATGRMTGDGSNEAGSFTLFPNSAGSAPEYEMFLLSMDRIRAQRSVGASNVSNALHLSSRVGTSGPNYDFTAAGAALSEDDFIPGRGYAKLWLQEALLQNSVTMSTWDELFSEEIGYLSEDLIGVATDATLADGETANTYLGAVNDNGDWSNGQKVLTNHGLVFWTDIMGRWIENAREGLEYSRASPMFTVFDKDILDLTEARFRQMLSPWLMSTVGPLTFVGTMDATGASHSSETITGESRYEVISLSTGAGASALDEGDVEAEEETSGDDENPTVEVADKPEVE